MHYIKLPCFIAFVLSSVLLSAPVKAIDEANVNLDGVGLLGFDPVSYFNSDEPVKGSSAYTMAYEGAIYHFSTAMNRETFAASPAKFAPAYGGFCSYGVRVGKKFLADPDAWKIVDGRLFLQLDLGTQKIWSDEMHKNIEIADRLWPEIKPVSMEVLNQ